MLFVHLFDYSKHFVNRLQNGKLVYLINIFATIDKISTSGKNHFTIIRKSR